MQSVYVHVYVFVPEQTGSAPSMGPVMVSGSPQELFTTGGVGTICALLIQGTVEPPLGGRFAEGGVTVYVNTHCPELPVQSVYVHVYVFVPEQTGSGLITGPVIAKGFPQELFTAGGVGVTCAFTTHATVDAPGAGIVKVGGDTVYVYTQSSEFPVQSV